MNQKLPRDHTANETVLDGYDEYIMPIWKDLSVPVKRASGVTVEDYEGDEYLDLFSGISVTNVGHRNDAVVEAAKNQLEEFVHGCTYLHPHRPAVELAQMIAEITPGDLKKTFFCNSGTEAVEGAIKLARKFTSSKEVLSLEMSFHGRTLGSLALTGNQSYKADMAPTINDVAHAPAPYSYRCSTCESGPCDAHCAAAVDHVIDTHTAGDLAAIVVEPILGEGGLIVPSQEWMQRIREIATERDALLIVDEVQTGYGRTGHFFACEHFDIEPDIMPQAKGIANGLPLGAFTTHPEIADSFGPGDHLSTFGGNPVSCAAALATIEELQNGIVEQAAETGEWLSERLTELAESHNAVGETRGLGLMQGIEVVDPAEVGPRGIAPSPDPDAAKAIAASLKKAGIIIGVGGFYKNVLRIQPPLTISRDDLERTITAMDRCFSSL